ncbi:MAG: carboxypeptidase regulatory-like domain-containing protein [Patescibacteria group bacterium]
MFQNLSAGTYMLGVEQYFKAGGTSYTASFPMPINVNAANCSSNICTQNISVTDASTGAAVTLNISGTFSNDLIDIFAGGPGSFRKATSTLNGILTNDTSNSIKLNANGIWMVSFGPQMSTEMFGKSGPSAPTAWMVPKPQEVQVSGCPGACSVNPSTLTFNVSKANNTVKYIVRDASSNAIANAHVFAYSPAGGIGIDSSSNADGTGSLTMATGTYKMGADVAGMPSGVERSITVKNNRVYVDGDATGIALATMANIDLILTISKPAYTISGKVTDGTNAVTNAPVSSFRTDGPGRADTFTNSSGEYTLYVGNGTYTVQAFTPDYGKLPEKTITVSSASVSGQNFEPNASAIIYYTFTKSVVTDTNGNGSYAAADDEELANVQVMVKGTTGDLNNDGDTSDAGENVAYLNLGLTDTNGSSTLKLPPGTYNMEVWSPTLGMVSSTASSFTVSSAGAISSAPANVLTNPTGAVTVNLLDENGNTTTTAKAVVEFQLIGGKLDKVESFSNVASSTISLPKYDISEAINSSTSTNPNNFYLMTVDIPGIAASGLIVYGDSGTVMATSTAANGYWKVEVDGTETINIKLPSLKFINGTVKDASGTAVPDATVKLENSSTGEVLEVQADISGNYSGKISSGTYLVQAEKDGYLDTASSVTISANGALADSATTITAASYTISGTITVAGSAASGATVRAERLGGGTMTATTNSSGVYSVNVIVGDWKVYAAVDGYTERQYSAVVSVSTANIASININLTTSNTTLAGTASGTVTPQTGGSLSNSSAGFSIGAPSSALGSGANNYSMSAKETSNVVAGGSGTPLANEAKAITSYDNDGKSVTTLKKDVSIGATYTAAELTTSLGTATLAKIEKIKMASWDETADNWQNLATTLGYKNSSGNFIEPSVSAASVAFTGQTNHFSVFNPIAPKDNLAPSAPTNVTASAGNATVSITWTAPTTNADASVLADLLGYEIYRSTSAAGTYTQLNSSDLTSTSYTDSSAVNGTTYYYKVTAADTGGLESAMSSASSGVTPAAPPTSNEGGGAGTAVTLPVLGANSVVINNNDGSTVSRSVILTFNVTNATQMVISNDSSFAGASYIPYTVTSTWTLTPGNGAKTVYVKFLSATGGTSLLTSDFINLTGQDTAQKQEEAKKETKVEAKAGGCSLTAGMAYKSSDSSAIYYITEECKKRPFLNPKVFFTYFTAWKNVLVAVKSDLQAIPNDNLGFMPWGPKYDPKYGALVKIVSDPKVYLLLGTEKYWITSEAVFNALKYSWNWIEDIDTTLLDKYTIGSEINFTNHHPNYTLIKYKNNAKVYRLEPNPQDATKQVRRHVKNEATFNSLNFRWDRIVAIDDSETYSDGEVLQSSASGSVLGEKITSYKFTQLLQKGDEGEAVKQLQLKLKTLGFFSANIEANGNFGPATTEAVKKFQAANSIASTGSMGPLTMAKLNLL